MRDVPVKHRGGCHYGAVAFEVEAPSRLELLERNVKVFQSVVPQVLEYAPDSILLIVSNPVDIMTQVVTKISSLPPDRVSFAPWISDLGEDQGPRPAALLGAIKGGPRQRGLRTLDYQYVDFPDGEHPTELYSLERDPWELRNLAALILR